MNGELLDRLLIAAGLLLVACGVLFKVLNVVVFTAAPRSYILLGDTSFLLALVLRPYTMSK